MTEKNTQQTPPAPSNKMTIEYSFKVQRLQRGRKSLVATTGDEPRIKVEGGNVPRVARLMALAIHFEEILHDGLIRDMADLARLGHVTRARVTQIMNLRLLAPDIQEAILFLSKTQKGRDRIQYRHLAPLTLEPEWNRQRRMWKEVLDR